LKGLTGAPKGLTGVIIAGFNAHKGPGGNCGGRLVRLLEATVIA
jgi:hypothetical protein